MFRHSLRCFVFVAGWVFWTTSAVAEGIAGEISLGREHEVITFAQIRDLVESKERHARETLTGEDLVKTIKEIELAAIDELIDRTLILEEARIEGYTIPEKVVDEKVEAVIRDSFGGDRQAFSRSLVARGHTMEMFRAYQRDSCIVQAMRGEAMKGITNVSEEDWLQKLHKKAYIKIY